MNPMGQGMSTLMTRLRAFVDRRLERGKVQFVCLSLLAICLLLAVVSFLTFDGTYTVFGPSLGADFAQLYAAGMILNQYPADRLYNLRVQDQVYHELLPGLSTEENLPYLYAPFIALLFRPLALLPYAWACLVWMVISAGLYLGGLALIWLGRHSIPAAERSTALLLALSFWPFMECWLSGQTSVIGFAAIALALHYETLRRSFGLGFCLAFCVYKPPLLLWMVPMLVVAQRWRALGGFALGGLVLGAASLLAVGWRGCLAYARLLTEYSGMINARMVVFPKWKFVDLNNFLGLLFANDVATRRVAWLAIVLAALPFLARSWWTSDRGGPDRRMLVWAATLTWTLVLNLHVGYYDAILAVPGVILMVDVLYRRAGSNAGALTPGIKALLTLLYVVPWFSQHLARSLGFQPFTLVLMALGTYQLALASRQDAASEAETLLCSREATAMGVVR